MKPVFIVRHAQSKCGRFEIEADKTGTPCRLLEWTSPCTFADGRKADKVWTVVGEYATVGLAVKVAEKISERRAVA